MHTLTLDVQENILEKFHAFLATLPNDSVHVVEDIDDKLLAERSREVSDIIERVDRGNEKLHDFDSVMREIKTAFFSYNGHIK